MKFVLVIAVVGFVLWLMFGRGKRIDAVQRNANGRRGKPAEPVQMIECAHCGLHLPRSEALFDAAGRPYCGEPHRVAGPR